MNRILCHMSTTACKLRVYQKIRLWETIPSINNFKFFYSFISSPYFYSVVCITRYQVRDILELRALKALGYLNRIIFLMFYISTVINFYGEPSTGNGGESLYYTLNGLGLIILGFTIFTLSFIGDLYRYFQDRQRSSVEVY